MKTHPNGHVELGPEDCFNLNRLYCEVEDGQRKPLVKADVQYVEYEGGEFALKYIPYVLEFLGHKLLTSQELTDKWVLDQGRLGAMKIHPREFTADEILDELDADTLSEMTEDMAGVIVRTYTEVDDSLPADKYYAVKHAHEVYYG